MLREDIDVYRCPACRGRLSVAAGDSISKIENGTLACVSCARTYSVSGGIPRFVAPSNYADSFGTEWASFPRTLLDDTWQQLYATRFCNTCEFETDLTGQIILEAGCGPGSFTGIILRTGARVFSFDLSNSVDQCSKSHWESHSSGHLSLAQANIMAPPYQTEYFDKIVCLGVIQHCPDPQAAFKSLGRYLKPGGEIVIDCYLKLGMHANLQHIVKHAMRVVTTRLPHKVLLNNIRFTIDVLYEIKAALNRIPVAGDFLQRLIPIGKLQRFDWSPSEMKEMKTMNIFDMLSPKHDHPQSLDSVRRWIADEQLELIKCGLGENGINAKARRSISRPTE